MADAEEDLKATNSDLILDAARLMKIETEKSRLDPSDPTVLDLSRAAERIAGDIRTKAAMETRLAKETTGAS